MNLIVLLYRFQVPTVGWLSTPKELFITTVCKSEPIILVKLKNVNSPSSSSDLLRLDWLKIISREANETCKKVILKLFGSASSETDEPVECRSVSVAYI